MTIPSYVRLVVFAVCTVAVQGLAQGSRAVSVDPGGVNGPVNLSFVDSTAQYNFAKIFEIPMYQDYQAYALLLTNTSGQGIVAVTIRWTGTFPGRSGVYDSSTDSLGLQSGAGSGTTMSGFRERSPAMPTQLGRSWASAHGSVVVAAGERMLVAPGLFVREDVTGQRTTPGGSSSIPESLKTADAISATLDIVILEDGRVLGPDTSHTVDELRSRKAAIDAVYRAVMTAEQNGQDGVEALRQLASVRPTRESGPEVMQQSMIARRLMASRLWKEELQKMAAIQLPNFHR